MVSDDDLARKTIFLDHSYAIQPVQLPPPPAVVPQRQRIFPLKLINIRDKDTKNICFVNSIVQFIQRSGFGLFLTTLLPQFLSDVQYNKFRLSRTLMKLYSEDVREKSAADVRKIVAEHSKKVYFSYGSQQDCEYIFITQVLEKMSFFVSS